MYGVDLDVGKQELVRCFKGRRSMSQKETNGSLRRMARIFGLAGVIVAVEVSYRNHETCYGTHANGVKYDELHNELQRK